MPTVDEISQLWQIHNGPERAKENLLRSYGFDQTRSWIDPNGHRLSDRIWRARQDVRSQIDDVLRKAIANGTDALEVADILEQFLDPSYAPVRNAGGRLIRNQARGIVTSAPGRAGMGSFSARRLARTEITRAHGMATIEVAKRTPFAKGVKWNLSARHPRPDTCDRNAERDDGLGRGVYAPGNVPRYPEHPQDLCWLGVETEPDVDKVVAGLREQYGLGEGGVAKQPWEQPFERISDKNQAQAWFGRYGIETDGTNDASMTILNNWAEGFHNLRARGYDLPTQVYFGADPSSPHALAKFSNIGKEIFVNTANPAWKSIAKHERQAFSSTFSSGYDPRHTVYHETAHYLHSKQVSKRARGTIDGKVVDTSEFFKSIDEMTIRPFTPDETRLIQSKVSRYGATSPSEFVAEVFAAAVGDPSMRRSGIFDPEVLKLYEELGGPPLP